MTERSSIETRFRPFCNGKKTYWHWAQTLIVELGKAITRKFKSTKRLRSVQTHITAPSLDRRLEGFFFLVGRLFSNRTDRRYLIEFFVIGIILCFQCKFIGEIDGRGQKSPTGGVGVDSLSRRNTASPSLFGEKTCELSARVHVSRYNPCEFRPSLGLLCEFARSFRRWRRVLTCTVFVDTSDTRRVLAYLFVCCFFFLSVRPDSIRSWWKPRHNLRLFAEQ